MREKIAYWVDIVLGVGVIALTIFGQVAGGYLPQSKVDHARVNEKNVEESHSVCSNFFSTKSEPMVPFVGW